MRHRHRLLSRRAAPGALAALALSALLSACGGSGSESDATASAAPAATPSNLPVNTLALITDTRYAQAGSYDLTYANGVVFDDTTLMPGTTLRVVSIDAGQVGAVLYYALNDPSKHLVVVVNSKAGTDVAHGCRSAGFVTPTALGSVPLCNQPVQIDVAGKTYRFDRLTLIDVDTGDPDLVASIHASWQKLPVKPADTP